VESTIEEVELQKADPSVRHSTERKYAFWLEDVFEHDAIIRFLEPSQASKLGRAGDFARGSGQEQCDLLIQCLLFARRSA